MDEVVQFLHPVTERLPQSWQDYLTNGGWPVVLGVAAIVLLLLFVGVADRLWRKLFRRRHRPDTSAPGPEEDLARLPPPLLPPGERQFAIYHVPARVRLVVAATAGAGRDLDEKRVKKYLERIWPGVREVLTSDKPQIRIWPPQLSQQGFAMTFHRHLLRPESQAQSSVWTSVSGKIQFEGETLMLGLVLLTSEKTTFGQLTLEPHQWRDIIRLGPTAG